LGIFIFFVERVFVILSWRGNKGVGVFDYFVLFWDFLRDFWGVDFKGFLVPKEVGVWIYIFEYKRI